MSEPHLVPASARSRLGFIDAARALALLLMLQGHVCDTLLDSAQKSTLFFQRYWHLRGLTGPLFFMLSGFAFVVASNSSWETYGRFGPKLNKRLRRVGSLMLIGYFFQMPRWSGSVLFDFTAQEWSYLLRSGVLHCIGWSLLTAHVLLALTKSKRRFTWAAASLAVVVLFAAPSLRVERLQLPTPLALLVQPDAGSLFPLFPWMVYFLVGLTIGRLYLDGQWFQGSVRRLGGVLAIAGAVTLGSRIAWGVLDPAFFANPARWSYDPSLFLLRAGGSWLIFAAVCLAVGTMRSPAWLKSTSSNSLSIYATHLVVIYGAPYVPGLIHRLGTHLSLGQVFLVGPALLAFCAAFMGTFDWAWDSGAEALRGWRRPAPATSTDPT